LPEVPLSQSSNQGVLDKVVGPLEISGKRPRITAQSRDLLFEKTIKIRHKIFPGHNGRSGNHIEGM
jgi:hypothetical protein